jgi:hypothetical protein
MVKSAVQPESAEEKLSLLSISAWLTTAREDGEDKHRQLRSRVHRIVIAVELYWVVDFSRPSLVTRAVQMW